MGLEQFQKKTDGIYTEQINARCTPQLKNWLQTNNINIRQLILWASKQHGYKGE